MSLKGIGMLGVVALGNASSIARQGKIVHDLQVIKYSHESCSEKGHTATRLLFHYWELLFAFFFLTCLYHEVSLNEIIPHCVHTFIYRFLCDTSEIGKRSQEIQYFTDNPFAWKCCIQVFKQCYVITFCHEYVSYAHQYIVAYTMLFILVAKECWLMLATLASSTRNVPRKREK